MGRREVVRWVRRLGIEGMRVEVAVVVGGGAVDLEVDWAAGLEVVVDGGGAAVKVARMAASAGERRVVLIVKGAGG